jgi:murein L,D-transpeptidase YcbB/YkuD
MALLGTAGCLGDSPEELVDAAGAELADEPEDPDLVEEGQTADEELADEDAQEPDLVPEDEALTDAEDMAVPNPLALPTCYRTASLDTGHVGPVAVPSAGTTRASTSCIMGLGATSNAVRRLQINLNACYAENLQTDRVFGTLTRNALKRAQRSEGVVDDGVYGPNTRDALLWWTGNICSHIIPP